MNQNPQQQGPATRLDQYVTEKLETASRALCAKVIDRGLVSVNGEPVTKSSYKVKTTDVIVIDYDPNIIILPEDIDLPVIYEDDDCVVINKPPGILAHSKGDFNDEPTVASWLSGRLKDMDGNRAGIVHRLDRATSGVMICAKNPIAQKKLQKQFADRKVKKSYMAIVAGHLKEDQAIIDMAIERNPKKPQTFRVGINGKNSVTAYRVLKTSSKYSLMQLTPTTGRTHQLRVHLSHIGHPIVGDLMYGGKKADRLYLHALSLEITIPKGSERKVFTTKLPSSFDQLMDKK
jgi:23S rRNA pseudouridine1911/1915/1917 synthase